jgi:hypothetical protein
MNNAYPLTVATQPLLDSVHGAGELTSFDATIDKLESSMFFLLGSVACLRNQNECLVGELRRHNVDIPKDTPSDLQILRAWRAVHGIDALPAYVMLHPVTGAYTTVEARYRTHFQIAFPETDLLSGIAMNDLWTILSDFVCDLVRLEQLRLDLGPQLAPNSRS